MLQFKVMDLKTKSELVVIAAKKVEPGIWHTKNTKAKVGELVKVSNGLGITFPAERIAQLTKPCDTILRRIGSAIHKSREAAGMTQADLAEKTELSIHYIRKIEQGQRNITINQLQRIVEATGAKTFDIVIS